MALSLYPKPNLLSSLWALLLVTPHKWNGMVSAFWGWAPFTKYGVLTAVLVALSSE